MKIEAVIRSRLLKVIFPAILALTLLGTATESASATTKTVLARVQGSGTGTLSSDPVGINNCRADTDPAPAGVCSAPFDVGQEITMTAHPDPGSTFVSWGVGICGSPYATTNGNQCTFTVGSFDYGVNGPRVTFAAKPANDDFVNATSIPVDPGQITGDTTGATHEPGEPAHGASGESASVWHKWTAPATGQAVASTCVPVTSFDDSLAVYTGTAIDNLQLVAASDNGTDLPFECELQAAVSFSVTRGTTYRFAVDGADGALGRYMLAIYLTRTVHQLDVGLGGSGSGTVSSSPGGIFCASATISTCSTTIEDNKQIVLTPRAAAGSTFSGFSGACSGTGPCTLTVLDDSQVTATFTRDKKPITLELGKPALNEIKGSALVPVTVSGPATITLTGSDVRSRDATTVGRETVEMTVSVKGKLAKKLKKKGKATAEITVAARGADNTPSEKLKVKLKRK